MEGISQRGRDLILDFDAFGRQGTMDVDVTLNRMCAVEAVTPQILRFKGITIKDMVITLTPIENRK
jgi:hypothetical protein